MKKYLFLLIFLIGCATTYQGEITILSDNECQNVPEIWWGKKGQNPGETDLWKCYPWVLEVREE